MPSQIVFTDTQRVEVDLRPPRDGEVVVRTLYTLMSTGTVPAPSRSVWSRTTSD